MDRLCLLEVKEVTKKFKEHNAISTISFSGSSGEIIGFIGHNGSGKTVLFKCICGFLFPSSGEIIIQGKNINETSESTRKIGAVIEEPAFLGNYSGFKNLEFLYRLNHKKDSQLIRFNLERVGLDWKSRKKVKNYSLGMKQRLSIAQAIMEDPDIIILDEPMNGLDKHGIAEIRSLLLKKKEEGKLIILASHNSADIDFLCDRVYELENGIMTQLTKNSHDL